MDDITIRITRLLINEASFTKEEMEDAIEIAMERLSKGAIKGKVTMKGIVSFLQKIGLQNKPDRQWFAHWTDRRWLMHYFEKY